MVSPQNEHKQQPRYHHQTSGLSSTRYSMGSEMAQLPVGPSNKGCAAARGFCSNRGTISMLRSQREGDKKKIIWKRRRKMALFKTWKSHSLLILPGKQKPRCFMKIKPAIVSQLLVFSFNKVPLGQRCSAVSSTEGYKTKRVSCKLR